KRPSLLKYNLPGGMSGCGKMRTCYELLCENWGLYFVTSRKGNGGSADIDKIQSYLDANMTEDFDKNRKYALEIMRCTILSRLFILRHCLKNASAFNKQRWLLIQICQDTFGKLYDYNDNMFVALMFQLNTCTSSSVMTYIDNIYQEISDSKTFVIILDETQVLETVLKGKFKSRITLREPAPSMVNHCVIPCDTGLKIFSLEDVLITGISKPETEISKFTEFEGWQDIAHVKNYVNNLVNIIMGSPAEDAVNAHWKVLTKAYNNDKSLYNQLCRIIEMERPNHVLSTNIPNLYKSVTLAYYYSGGPFLFTDISQMSLVESGFGRLRFVNPPTISHLKQECKGIDEDKLRISSVNVDLLHPVLEGKKSLVAYVDEPFALTAFFNFFKDHDSLPKEILNIMSIVNNASSWGTLWQIYLTDEFERMFNGKLNIRNMLVFAEVAKKYDLPAFCIGSPKIAKSSNDTVLRVANASAGYTLEKFFNESPETCPTFYFPEDRYGPDLIFFVEFEEVTVPVFVQMKLRYSVKEMAGALSTIHPDMFYKDKNRKVYNEESNKHIINKIIKICEVSSIGLLVAYPADVFQESYVTNNHPYDIKNLSSN
ncbi:18861_t:CDS:2, partial [Funneliformis geosporum]